MVDGRLVHVISHQPIYLLAGTVTHTTINLQNVEHRKHLR